MALFRLFYRLRYALKVQILLVSKDTCSHIAQG